MNERLETICVPRERAGLELDEFLCLLFPQVHKGYLRERIRTGSVLLDGAPAQPSARLRTNQVVTWDFDENEAPVSPLVAPEDAVPILYEDEAVLVVDKPSDLAVEPERWARDRACLAGALLEVALERGREGEPPADAAPVPFRPRLVHRIDKDTSGCVLVAKDLETERRLRRAFEEGAIEKRYLALVEGEHPLEDGESEVLDRPIGADARRSGRMRVDTRDGKPSRTRIRVAERFRGFTLMAAEPLTGRTHQIRVHLADAGFPLVVDPLYGRRESLPLSEIKAGYRSKPGRVERPLLGRLSLHAERVAFPLPAGDTQRVEAPLPADLARTLKQLAKVRPWRARR